MALDLSNTYRKFRQVWTVACEICEWAETGRQTNRYTHPLIAIPRTPIDGEVINVAVVVIK